MFYVAIHGKLKPNDSPFVVKYIVIIYELSEHFNLCQTQYNSGFVAEHFRLIQNLGAHGLKKGHKTL